MKSIDISLEVNANLFLVLAVLVIIGVTTYQLLNRTPKEFEYKKHQYIEFPSKSVVHDPNCKQFQLVFD